ncbi:MAG: hypothetical protein NWE89_11055 [Candidatus Bathyarchaeota archaeon]|nr:hypothetical protein [Candidatus Bathyarchaeota archaeon]
MFIDEEITPEEEEEIIEWVAREFYKYGLETAAILFIESYKPISRIGASMGQVFFTPLLPLFGDNAIIKGEKVFTFFQESSNVERLIQRLEEIAANGIEPKEKELKKSVKKEEEGKTSDERKGWRKYLPF